MTTIHFVSAEKGGVGKTHTASLLIEHMLKERIPFTAFDADRGSPVLTRRYNNQCGVRAVDLRTGSSADHIYYQASEDRRNVVVDLPAASGRDLAAWQKASGLFESAHAENVGIIYWHVLDGDPQALPSLRKTLDSLADIDKPRLGHVIVRNKARGENFSAYDGVNGQPSDVKLAATALGAVEIALPSLDGEVALAFASEDMGFSARLALKAGEPMALKSLTANRVRTHLDASLSEISRALEALANARARADAEAAARAA